MQKNIRKNKQSDKKIENKKSYSSDELNETDNPIKIYKVDVATAIDNHSKTEHHETDITEKELNNFLLILIYYLKQMKKKTVRKSQMLKTEYLIF